MELRSFLSLETQIKDELDLDDEEFVLPRELKQYINDAIDVIEAAIHKGHREDIYFLTKDTLTLVAGTADYQYPSNIYAGKIVRLVYDDGTQVYEIRRMRSKDRFLQTKYMNRYPSSTAKLSYMAINNESASSDGRRIRFFATPQVSGAYVERWYIRNMHRYGSDSTELCDLPEFYRFVVDYVKVKVAEKEPSPMLATWQANLEATQKLTIDTLADQAEDEDSEIPLDDDFYLDHI